MRWLLVLVAFVVVPLAELWAILSVGDAIGVLPTILILLADSVLGALLLRAQGRGAWRRFVKALRLARVPSREVADGLLIVVGGALLLTPGFLTDGLGLLLLIPPSRALVRRGVERAVARRMATRLTGAAGGTAWRASDPRSERPRAGGRGAFDVDGHAVEHENGAWPERRRLER